MNKSKTIISSTLGVLSSCLSFLGIISCCGLPIIAGILASIGIGVSQLAFFAEYRTVFIALAIGSILFGFYQVYFKKNKTCCNSNKEDSKQNEDSCCSEQSESRKSQRIQKVFLWVATAVVIFMLIWGNEFNSIEASVNSVPIEVREEPTCCPNENTITEETKPVSCCPQ